MDSKDTGHKPPRWDLRDLFPSKDSPEFRQTLTSLERETRSFADTYAGHVARLSAPELAEAIARYEQLSEKIARVASYVHLLSAADQGETIFAATINEKLNGPAARLIFFPLEINAMRDFDLFNKISHPALAHYTPWLGQLRSLRAHQLDDVSEKYISQKNAVADDAWRRLYTQSLVNLRYNVGGKTLTTPEIMSMMNHAPSSDDRRAAYAEFGRVLGENKKLFALVTNTLADLKKMQDGWRGFDNPEDARHLSNRIDAGTVNAMTEAVRHGYARTAHRYYAWKAKKMGEPRLHPADRNAPLPGQNARVYTWDEARDIVLDAYRKLSPDMAEIAQRFFDNGWIDAEPRAGKGGGAFSHRSVPSAHPYIMMNFFGTARDVMTLAHELGHGIHQVLAAENGFLKSPTPLTLSETASVFGEMLVFRHLLDAETDPAARRAMIASKVEDMLNTVVRQTSFHFFESRVHNEHREKGELTPERLSAIWQETQKESLGHAVNLDQPGAENLWMAVPHFIKSPFYVYAYAFGECLVNVLYDEYIRAADKDAFAEKYTNLLRAGGTLPHDVALAPFGFNPADPQFWRRGLAVIERYIDELAALDAQIGVDVKSAADFNAAAAPAPVNDNAKPAARKKRPPAPGGAK